MEHDMHTLYSENRIINNYNEEKIKLAMEDYPSFIALP